MTAINNPAAPAGLTIATFDNYAQAQDAVDLLADKGFEVGSVRIIGHDIKTVEQVVDNLTYGKSAWQGALAGAWFGLMIGLLMAIFAPVAIGWTILSSVLFGAVWGIIFGLIWYAINGKERSFHSARALAATTYTLEVAPTQADEALRLLAQGR
ncbi:general stress protein [Propionibacteriaceae bacterium G1746]|uniref:general stress protein n=1 Tax=Aestuariimicrobium sp. G57 TaxID=3418485 RepID=UPI003C28D491